MIRSTIVLIALCAAVLLLPFWLQLTLFALGVWVAPHRLLLLIPAILADVLYSPQVIFSVSSLLMTLSVAVLLLIRWLLLTQTRFASFIYGLEA